jgi:hypothetical protein
MNDFSLKALKEDYKSFKEFYNWIIAFSVLCFILFFIIG